MRLKLSSCTFAVLFLHILQLSTFLNAKETVKIKRENWSTLNNLTSIHKKKQDFNLSNNISNLDGRIRSIHKLFYNITSTEGPSKRAINNFSLEFLDCTHTYLEPEEYVMLPNKSVYINVYNILLNTSNYILRNGKVFTCPFYPTSKGRTVAPRYLINTNNTGRRFRRSESYPFSQKTEDTSKTSTAASVPRAKLFNCKRKTYFRRMMYEKLSDGSVYVRSLNRTYNSSDFSIKKELLIICADSTGKTNERPTEETTLSFSTEVADICNITIDPESDEGRVRRSTYYTFDTTTTTTTTIPPSNTTIDVSILSAEFLNCTHTYVEPECYEKLPNGSMYVPVYNRVFDIANYVIREDLLIICPSFFPTYAPDKFTDDFGMISFVCTWISSICIVLHIIAFVVIKKLRNLPGYCLLSLCIALVAAYICTFVVALSDNKEGCTVLGMFMCYFFLVSFFWMNAMAYDVWKSIRMAISKLRSTTGRPIMVQFSRYSLYAWGTPLMIVFIAIIVHYSAPESSKYRLIFLVDTCWFMHKQALALYFTGPLLTLIGMNVFFFFSSFYMITNGAMSKSHKGGSKGTSDLWSRLLLCLRLSSVMGFTYILGIIAMLTKWKWMLYLYSTCSGLQGVFIFISFTVNERTRKICVKAIHSRKFSISPTQTSSQQGTSISQKNMDEQSV